MTHSGKARPLVSVIVPSFNQGRFIAATLDSILAQSYRPIEVLVIDGGSTDETLEVLERYRQHTELSWVSERDRGPADAVNKGLAKARGEFAAIQSSDDLYLPGAIMMGVEALLGHPEALVVYGDSIGIDAEGKVIWRDKPLAPYTIENFLLRTTGVPQGSAFFRLSAARAVGGWSDSLYVADTDMWLKIAFTGPMLKIDAELSALRVHDAQRDKNNRRIFEDYWRMLLRCKPLRSAPLHLKRAAVAGAASLIQRHDAYQSKWVKRGLLVLAVVAHPQGRSLIWGKNARLLELPSPFKKLAASLRRHSAR